MISYTISRCIVVISSQKPERRRRCLCLHIVHIQKQIIEIQCLWNLSPRFNYRHIGFVAQNSILAYNQKAEMAVDVLL
jgi:hypothetical protein